MAEVGISKLEEAGRRGRESFEAAIRCARYGVCRRSKVSSKTVLFCWLISVALSASQGESTASGSVTTALGWFKRLCFTFGALFNDILFVGTAFFGASVASCEGWQKLRDRRHSAT